MNKVIFEKPDIKKLKKEGYICIDMHVHSEYSSDSNNKVKDILKRAEELGIGIAITDHNDIRGSLEACKQKKVLVIPSIEVRSKEGLDILFYFSKKKDIIDFYNKIIMPNKKKTGNSKLSALELIEKQKKYRKVACLAHPYRPSPKKMINWMLHRQKIRYIFDEIEGFEVVNSKNLRRFNNKTIRFSEKNNKIAIGGSDAHTISRVCSSVTCVKKEKRKKVADYFLDGILKNKAIIVGKEINLILDLIEISLLMIKKKIRKIY